MLLKKIFDILSLKHLSFTSKIILSFFVFIIIFSIFRAILILPKIQDKNKKEVIDYVSKTLQLTKVQFQVTGKSLQMQTDLEIKLNKEKIKNELEKINSSTILLEDKKILDFLDKNKIISRCSYGLININSSYNSTKILNKWIEKNINEQSKSFRNKTVYIYNYKIKNQNKIVSLTCSKQDLNPNHWSFEKNLKEHINTKLLYDASLSSSKTALFWLNPSFVKNKKQVLYTKKDKEKKSRYTLSLLSNVKNIPTGSLSLEQILNSKENIPIEHEINNKKVLTWIIKLSTNIKENRYFLLAHTIDKEDIDKKNNVGVTFLLTETLIAVGLSFFIILLFIKRILKNIEKVTKTAIQVNQGKKNIRCNVKDEDDIGILGQAFDSMLDFFENSIKTLDKKVEEKTKEITKSLEEKELLLKEIHHRVKNNLALTIGLIELQEEEVKDEKTKKVLIDIQERVFTMELLHRKLYESSNINDIFFDEYVIDLIEVISSSYDIEKKVKTNIVVDKIKLNIEKAMPCGLVLNELITNSYKYAFNNNNNNDNAKLDITINKKSSDLIIIVKDNGCGLKKDFDEICDDTLGLKLVFSIIKYQLFGQVKYEYDNGAKFIIKIEI
ncbi:histidine kinase [Malaciobacter canalis]|uniref:histidine kinase n=1 Tax=Malaciobacter canalis TaxID=1912871 RepID=A0ABX4LVU1_9BACT|nr:histidine kinase dimerization/phosphoacceptor domain -containing protein [Malaciobacter canalis]PHO10619.1 histidine kinase [Malaciobacter canalis]QEE32067.1 two-component system sensor histidine kinase [Malaciobacter canalis]